MALGESGLPLNVGGRPARVNHAGPRLPLG
jgi:hypothetical protein